MKINYNGVSVEFTAEECMKILSEINEAVEAEEAEKEKREEIKTIEQAKDELKSNIAEVEMLKKVYEKALYISEQPQRGYAEAVGVEVTDLLIDILKVDEEIWDGLKIGFSKNDNDEIVVFKK